MVTFVRSALACVLAREEWPADGAGRVLLASTEALTNAIEHGSPLGGRRRGGADGHRRARRTARAGPGPSRRAVPVLPEAPPPPTDPRGRGLIIISRLADDFDLRAAGVGTEISAGFLRATASAAEPQPYRRAA